jgi:hypothetical protein
MRVASNRQFGHPFFMNSPTNAASHSIQNSKGYSIIDCSSAEELWELLAPKELGVHKTIYRGQAEADWKLIPKVLRKHSIGETTFESFIGTYVAQKILTVEMQITEEINLLSRFVEECDRIGIAIPNDSVSRRRKALNKNGTGRDRFQLIPAKWPDDDWTDIMALAQHHGLPTRLLDWSRRSHVAAYFAASDALTRRVKWETDSRLAIWALDSAMVEGLTCRPTGNPPFKADSMIPHVQIITVPGATSNHLAAQAGLFTLQKESGERRSQMIDRSLEDDLPTSPVLLHKYTLPKIEAAKLLRLCALHEITATTIFRSYDGAVKAVLDSTAIWSEGLFGTNPTAASMPLL